jgi:NAD(P)-dependent dehydrogenase (short-subunit alcohol dehydrogenase family)
MLMPSNYVPTPDLLADRNVLISGAGDGIGKALAMACARAGASTLLLGRTTSKLEAVYDEIIAAGLPKPAIVPLDLTAFESNDVNDLIEAIDTNYGALHGLVHNAALLGERVPLAHYDTITWHRVMQVNVNAVFVLTRALLPALDRANDASLIFTSSGVGKTPRAYWGAYSVSKYALEGLAMLLADELENVSGIRSNILNPGATRTGMRAAAYPNEDPATLKTPEAVLPYYLWLLGRDSAGVHGQRFDA